MESLKSESEKTPGGKPERKWRKRIVKFGVVPLLILFVVSAIWYQAWKLSGSGQWELERKENGVVVHTKKVPGDELIKVKGVGRIKASMASIFKLMRDAQSCEDAGCYNAGVLETKDYPRIVYYQFTYPLFFPFKDREYVVVSEFYQNPETKEIKVDYRAAPDRLPRNDCCVRITRMNNRWRFTPLENGEVEVEFVLDNGQSGNFPNVLLSLSAPGLVAWAINDFQRILDQDKYKNAPPTHVKEVDYYKGKGKQEATL